MPIVPDRDIYAAARAAGFSPDEAVTMTAIALAESGGNTSAHNPSGEDSRGLWQINVDAHPGIADRFDLLDPLGGARAAYAISAGGVDISPWTVTHGHGSGRSAHEQLLGRARAAAAGYEGRARLRRRAGAALVVTLGALLVGQLWTAGQDDSVPAGLSAEAASGAPATASGGPSAGKAAASATAVPSRMSTPTATPTPKAIPTPTRAATPTPSPAPTPPMATPSPAPALTQQPTPVPTSRPAVPPPSITAVRVTSVSSVCVRFWSARVVALVTGEVVSVTALWSTMDGVEGGQAAMAPDGAGWAGTVTGLPVDGSVMIRVKAQGRGGTVESETADYRCAP